jgi:hypothetical protein
MGAHNLPATGLMNFRFKWKHRDGSMLEFGPTGWTSDDPQKIDCLLKSYQPSGSGVAIPPDVRKLAARRMRAHGFQWSERLDTITQTAVE